jgi:hypothetical protein
MMEKETICRGGRPVQGFALGRGGRAVGFLGADVPPQSKIVAAVLAYRAAWNPYVLAVLRNMATVADSFDAVAAQPPTGFTSDELKKLGAAYRAQAQAMLAAWNQFAGLTPSQIEEQSGVILSGWQDTIQKVSKLSADEKIDQFAGGVKWPDPPSQDVQDKVLADLKAVAIDPSFLGILGLTGSRALERVDGGLSSLAAIPAWIAAHKTALIVSGVAVGGVVVLGVLSPYVKLLTAVVPHRRPA